MTVALGEIGEDALATRGTVIESGTPRPPAPSRPRPKTRNPINAGTRRVPSAPAPSRPRERRSGPSPYATNAAAGAGAAGINRLGQLAPKTGHHLIVAEFLFCLVLIIAQPMLTPPSADQSQVFATKDISRLCTCLMLFFVLALIANSDGGARIAAAFGGLVSLGVLYTFTQSPAWSTLESLAGAMS